MRIPFLYWWPLMIGLMVLILLLMLAPGLWLAISKPACAKGFCASQICMSAGDCIGDCNVCMRSGPVGFGYCVQMDIR